MPSSDFIGRRLRRAILLCLAPLLLTACEGAAADQGSTPAPARAPSARPQRMQVVKAQAVEHRATWEVRGVLEPYRTAGAAFIVGGRLTKVMVERGDQVEEGQVLARLDGAEVGAGVAQARAAIAAADAQVRLADDALRRLETLTDRGAVAQSEVVKVRLQRESALALRSQASAALQMVQVKGGQHVLRSPISGTVLEIPDRVGEIIGPGIPQFEIADLTKLRLRGSLPEEASGQIRLGQTVTIHRRTGEGLTGEISYISPALSADTHRLPFEVEARPPAEGAEGVANSYVRVEVEAAVAARVAKVPATALVRGEQTSVFVDREGVAKRRQVTVVRTLGDQVLLLGVQPGDALVDLPPVDLEDGAPIER